MRLTFLSTFLLLAAAVAAIVTSSEAGPTDAPQPLRVTAEIISQRYCPTDAQTYAVIFKLRTKFLNQSDHKLIIGKGIGSFIPHLTIASDAKKLSDENYEWYTNEDWVFGQTSPETPEEFRSPGPGYVILAPGESIQNEGEYNATAVGSLPGVTSSRRIVQPGDHVLGYLLWTWMYHTKPEDIHRQWESFGDLVYETIKVGPVPFNLPADPKIEKCN
jgi:hypothetical protein